MRGESLADRLRRLRERMAAIELDGLLVTQSDNLRYLTAFTGSTGVALITRTEAFFVTNAQLMRQAQQQVTPQHFIVLEGKPSLFEKVQQLVAPKNLTNLGFEASDVSFNLYDELADLFDIGLIPVTGMIEALREVKDTDEIDSLAQAAKLADWGYQRLLKIVHPGMTEFEVVNQLEYEMRQQGVTDFPLPMRLLSGTRSALAQGTTSQRIIGGQELLTVDFGCRYQGYVARLTRTFAIGLPEQQLQEVYGIVLEAQLDVIANLKPGLTGMALDQIARQVVTKSGYSPEFGPLTGFGVGLTAQEGPLIQAGEQAQLVPGNIVTIAPGIYLPGLGGVRIADDLLVTVTGCQNLTQAPKRQLISL
ncbi:proline dipeptidase [Loigolactobacillus bifermentans DSM 20003]|uniref:Proline dipeptidase n=1 Tax=Loigolactobacillus bifermentans DSM 20003 TaxID=1423726 RepID=A0A0R1H809_9LACO|nr:proline dipeptidase [Loigolactobacillus bifermentans DSM 20003]